MRNLANDIFSLQENVRFLKRCFLNPGRGA